MRLKQQLWVVLSVLYLMLAALVVFAIHWPTAEEMWHRDSFVERMPAAFRGQVEATWGTAGEWIASVQRQGVWKRFHLPGPNGGEDVYANVIPLQPPGFILASVPVPFPNGATLQIQVQEDDGEVDPRVAQAYWAEVERETRTVRIRTLGWATLLWVSGCALLYIAGWTALRRNGWQRSWVVASVAYLIPVYQVLVPCGEWPRSAETTWFEDRKPAECEEWPRSERTWHRVEFIDRMPAAFRGQVEIAYRSQREWEQAVGGGAKVEALDTYLPWTELTNGRSLSLGSAMGPWKSRPVRFDNGAILQIQVLRGYDYIDMDVAEAYWAVVEQEAQAARVRAMGQAGLFWAISCAALYLAGWAVARIRRESRKEV